jgi:hypothetical protein
MTRYQKALAATEAAANGLAISINRFSGADAAGSTAGRLLQAAAAKAHSAELVAALPAQQSAARPLASILRATHTDLVLKASDRQTLIRKLSSPGGVPASMIAQLTRRGAVTSATELRQILGEALAGLPKTLSLAGALSAPSSAAGFTQLYRTLDVYEVAALVRGLTAQGAVSAEVEGWLLDDLRDTVTATSGDEKASALSQYDSDANETAEPAASLLRAAGKGLG